MSLRVSTQKKQAINYRFGQDFTYDNVTHAWRRQGYANRLVVQTVDDAIGKGFNIIDVATKKPIEKNAEAKEIIDTMWVDLKQTIYYERAYGKAMGMFFVPDGRSIPIWRAYDVRHYYASYDKFGFPFKYQIISEVGGVEAKSETQTVIDDELDFTYEIIIREDSVKGEGLSILEPVWDTLFGLNSLDENAVYYAIRYGPGIRYMRIPKKKLTDKVYMASVMGMLRGTLGINGVYTIPYVSLGDGKTKDEFSIESEDAVQINFTMLQDMLLTTLAAQTGIPMEVWRGAMQGLRSSETNEDKYFDYLQAIQADYRTFFKWIVNMLNTLFGWYAETIIIDIDYVSRDTLSKTEKIEMTGKQVDIINKAGFNISMEWLSGAVDIPIEMLETKVIPPQLLGSSEDDAEEHIDDDEDEEIEDEDDEDE